MSEPRYVLICGSRSWTDYLSIYRTVRLLHVLLGSFTVLHGGARGADTYAGLAARQQQIPEKPDRVTPEEWEKFGKPAGNMRNSRMLDRKPLLVIGFWDGSPQSTGTPDCLAKARELGIPTFVCQLGETEKLLDQLTRELGERR